MATEDDVMRCSACASEDLERGRIHAERSVTFLPDGVEALSTTRNDSPIYAYMCMGCGLIQLYGVRKLVAEAVGRFTG